MALWLSMWYCYVQLLIYWQQHFCRTPECYQVFNPCYLNIGNKIINTGNAILILSSQNIVWNLSPYETFLEFSSIFIVWVFSIFCPPMWNIPEDVTQLFQRFLIRNITPPANPKLRNSSIFPLFGNRMKKLKIFARYICLDLVLLKSHNCQREDE